MAFVFQIMNTLKNLFFGLTGSSLLCKGLPQFRALSSLQQGGGGTLRCSDISCCRARALGCTASIVVVWGLSCPTACEIFPDQGSNPCPRHWRLPRCAVVETLPGSTGIAGSIPGSGRSPGEGNTGNLLHILAWRIPWIVEPGGLRSMGSHRVRHA